MKKSIVFIVIILGTMGSLHAMEAGQTPAEIAELQALAAARYLQSLRTQLRTLASDPAMQNLLQRIIAKRRELHEKKNALRDIERERPSGARTWDNIRDSYDIAEQNRDKVQSELDSLEQNSLYLKYQQLIRDIRERSARVAAPPPLRQSPLPAAAEAEPPLPPGGIVIEPIAPPSPHSYLKPAIAAAGTAAVIGAVYAGLKWYQRRRIVRTLNRHDLKLTMLTPTQKDALAVAFLAGHYVPGNMRKLSMLVAKPDFASTKVPEKTMWYLLAELYYRTTPMDEQVAELKKIVWGPLAS